MYQKVSGAFPYDGLALYINASNGAQSTLAAAQLSGSIFALSASPPATFDDSMVHLLGSRRTGATLEMRVDGALSGSVTSAAIATLDVSLPGVAAQIGQNGYGTPQNNFQQFVGDIAEMIGVNGSLSAEETASLEAYLKARYSIP
jgi:hypothetical protein